MIQNYGTKSPAAYVPTTIATRNIPPPFRSCALGYRRGSSVPSSASSLRAASLPWDVPTSLDSSPLLLSSSKPDMFLLPDNPLVSPVAVVLLALVLLVSAQTFINEMLEGDQGLGAFLSDGTGYNKSGYRPNTARQQQDEQQASKDPLPWLKLPKLDFVEVAGQEETTTPPGKNGLERAESQEQIYDELDRLRLRLQRELETVRRNRSDGISSPRGKGSDENDDLAEARRLRAELEALMKKYGVDYETGSSEWQ